MRFKGILCGAALAGLGLLVAASTTRADSNLNINALAAPGAVIVSTGAIPYSLTNAVLMTSASGTVTELVVRDAITGGTDFLYQVTNVSTSNDNIEIQAVASYLGFPPIQPSGAGYLTPAGAAMYGLPAGNVIPANISETPAGTVNFSATIAPGYTSTVFVLETNAPSYGIGTINLIDNGVVPLVGFAPAAPAPASLWGGLGLFGLIGAVSLRRRYTQMA